MNDNFKKNPLGLIFGIFFLMTFLGPLLKSGNFWILLVFGLVVYAIYNKFIHTNKTNMSNTINVNPAFNRVLSATKKTVFGTLILVILLILLVNSIVVVDAGYTGVQSLFGKVKDAELQSGFHVINPFMKVDKMSIRTEEYTMSIAQGEGKKAGADAISSLTKEGLQVDLDITVLYHLNKEKASDVYKDIGLTYEEKLIRPSIRTSIRDVITQYEAKDIYSIKREEATEKIREKLANQLNVRGIEIEDVLLRNVVLPNSLANAIQEKLAAEQEAQKYDFLLQREEKEKERKIIEAEGQRDSQKIINESLSTNYLYYQYINSLKDREGTVYVPTSPDTGMPLFRELGR